MRRKIKVGKTFSVTASTLERAEKVADKRGIDLNESVDDHLKKLVDSEEEVTLPVLQMEKANHEGEIARLEGENSKHRVQVSKNEIAITQLKEELEIINEAIKVMEDRGGGR